MPGVFDCFRHPRCNRARLAACAIGALYDERPGGATLSPSAGVDTFFLIAAERRGVCRSSVQQAYWLRTSHALLTPPMCGLVRAGDIRSAFRGCVADASDCPAVRQDSAPLPDARQQFVRTWQTGIAARRSSFGKVFVER